MTRARNSRYAVYWILVMLILLWSGRNFVYNAMLPFIHRRELNACVAALPRNLTRGQVWGDSTSDWNGRELARGLKLCRETLVYERLERDQELGLPPAVKPAHP